MKSSLIQSVLVIGIFVIGMAGPRIVGNLELSSWKVLVEESGQLISTSDPLRPFIAIDSKEGTYDTNEGYFVESGAPPELSEALVDELYVVYDGSTVVLTSEVLSGFYRSSCPYSDSCETESPCVNVVKVRDYVDLHLTRILEGKPEYEIASNNAGHFTYRVSDTGIDQDELIGELVSRLTFRSREYRDELCMSSGAEVAGVAISDEGAPEVDTETPGDVVRVTRVEVAGTDGTYAERYLELDDSQQHLYIWLDGEIIDEYEISGFYDEYAVYGVFSIKNKSLNAWSPIAEKWMPFWMAFYYDPKQEAWFGIHELVYWTDDDGVYHEESSDSIGNKKSGGCVRLDRGEAEELYKWTKVGDPLLIHK